MGWTITWKCLSGCDLYKRWSLFVRIQPFWWSMAQRLLAAALEACPWPVSPSTFSLFADSCLQVSLPLPPSLPCPKVSPVPGLLSLWFSITSTWAGDVEVWKLRDFFCSASVPQTSLWVWLPYPKTWRNSWDFACALYLRCSVLRIIHTLKCTASNITMLWNKMEIKRKKWVLQWSYPLMPQHHPGSVNRACAAPRQLKCLLRAVTQLRHEATGVFVWLATAPNISCFLYLYSSLSG